MEKRNTLLLTVIAVATLLVAVVGATFAYFASTVETNNTVVVQATTAGANSSFIALGDEISLTVNAADMQIGQLYDSGTLDTTANKVVAEDNGTLNVTYLSGSTENTSCTYDIYYQWVDGNETEAGIQDSYELTDANFPLEFTYSIASSANDLTVSETNFVNTTATAQKVNSGSLSIANASDTTATAQTYTVTAKFYNINADQTQKQAGKTYSLKFYVDNVVC